MGAEGLEPSRLLQSTDFHSFTAFAAAAISIGDELAMSIAQAKA
jgi:hypothetical protein